MINLFASFICFLCFIVGILQNNDSAIVICGLCFITNLIIGIHKGGLND